MHLTWNWYCDFQRKTPLHYVEHSMSAASLFCPTHPSNPTSPANETRVRCYMVRDPCPAPPPLHLPVVFISLKGGVQVWNKFIAWKHLFLSFVQIICYNVKIKSLKYKMFHTGYWLHWTEYHHFTSQHLWSCMPEQNEFGCKRLQGELL